MEATAVNPALQSAIVDKYGKPFAQKTQQIVENLDMTVEKQDIVIEKQDQLGDKVKDVISNIQGTGVNFSDAFSRSSDGLKELSMGFIDIKGIVEEVGKKFSALNDLIAPIGESFAGINAIFQLRERKEASKQASEIIEDKLSDTIDDKPKKRSFKYTVNGKEVPEEEEKFVLFKGLRNFVSNLRDSGIALAASFGKLSKSIALASLKFLAIGGIIVFAAVMLGKLIEKLGGWELVADIANGLQNVFGRLQNGFRKFLLFLDDYIIGYNLSKDERKKIQQDIVDEQNRRTRVNAKKEDRDKVKEINESDMSQEDKDNALSELATSESYTNNDGDLVNLLPDGTEIVVREGKKTKDKTRLQMELDMVALEAQRRLPLLQQNVDNAKNERQKQIAEKALASAKEFIKNYNKNSDITAEEKIAQLTEEKGPNFGFAEVAEMVESDLGIKTGEFFQGRSNSLGLFEKFVLDANKTGNILKEQLDGNRLSMLESNYARRGQFAQIMAPSLTNQIKTVYESHGMSNVAEGLNDKK